MSLKNSKTECSPLEWKDMLYLTSELKNEKNHRMMLLVNVGCHFGLRIGDLLQLRWSQLLHKESFALTEEKTGKTRTISINNNVQELIQYAHEQLQPEINEYIFRNRAGNPLSIQFVNKQLHKIYTHYKIKIVGGSSHSLRKGFAKRVYQIHNQTEAALILLSQILNHSSIAITRKYIGLQQEQIVNAYLSL